MSDCGCDSVSYPYHAEMRKARKPHKCYECRAVIAAGERYEYASGRCEGEWFDARTCAKCHAVREYVVANVPCFCHSHGNMLEEADETIREYRHESPGMGMAYGRLRLA